MEQMEQTEGSAIHSDNSSNNNSSNNNTPTPTNVTIPDTTLINDEYQQLTYTDLINIDPTTLPIKASIKGRIHTVKNQRHMYFINVRLQNNLLLQVIILKNMFIGHNLIQNIPTESILVFNGILKSVNKPIESCTFKNFELELQGYLIISMASPLPFLITDASRDQSAVGLDLRFNYPWLNIRTLQQQITLKVKAKICEYFRNFLLQHNFVEIHTPKINGSSSEGGAEVFKLNYFGKDATLAQSPQLYKQMAINSDLDRVFEIGPVFRAEKFSHNRHLCEFISMDMEMTINKDYYEVITMATSLLQFIINSLDTYMSINYPDFNFDKVIVNNVPIINYDVAVQMINKHYEGLCMLDKKLSMEDDINNDSEKLLGQLVKQDLGKDMFVLNRFPATLRPFYTWREGKETRSFDIILRGQEISSGAQRQNNLQVLTEQIKETGIDPQSLKHYLDSFNYGSDLHGGCGIGLERLTSLYLNLGNVKKAAFVVRDPVTLEP